MNNKKPIIYKELSHDIIGAAMQVHNQLGPGWDEEAYHLAMVMALEARGNEHSPQRAAGYLTLSPFVQNLPMLYSKLIRTSPEGPIHH